MLVTTRNVDPRRSGSSSSAPQWTNAGNISFFKKAQWASNASNDTDLCYPDTASLEKRIEKVSNDAMSVDRLLRPRSLRPPVRPKFLWEQIRLSMQACNSQPSSKAKKSETELLGRLFLRQGLPPTTKSAVKARHDPFRLAPFRTRTHALPVFMQVIYLFRVPRLKKAISTRVVTGEIPFDLYTSGSNRTNFLATFSRCRRGRCKALRETNFWE